MQRINNLDIRGNHAEVAKFVERLERIHFLAHWKRDLDAEERLNSRNDEPSPGAFCYELGGGPLRPVNLILRRRGWDELQVTSIMTKDQKSLHDVEYNSILGDYYSNLLVPLSAGIKVLLQMTPPQLEMQEFLSNEAMSRLTEFSIASNKETIHVPDFLKWNRFVIQAHLDGAYLSDQDLDYWLMSDGFSDKDRQNLLGEFESGRTLLKTYDSERVH